MFLGLANSLRSLTTSPLDHAIQQAHKMARRRLETGGAAAPTRTGLGDGSRAIDIVIPPGVDAVEVAKAVRLKLGMSDGDDPLHPLERQKRGGRVVLRGRHLLRLGDGRFDRGRAFMHRAIHQVRTTQTR